MLADLTHEELSAALDAAAADALHRADWNTPPVDGLKVAERLGLTVAIDERLAGRARIVRPAGELASSILVRPEPRPERLHWAVAHEIGEHLASEIFARLGIHSDSDMEASRETVANQFAARLLLPTLWFRSAVRESAWDLLDLHQQFSTASHELIARRMLDLGEPLVITIFDQGQKQFRRSSSGRSPAITPIERECWQACRATGHRQQLTQGAISVQAWPLHEPHWQREILRTTWDE